MKPATEILFVHPRHRYVGRDNQVPMGVIALVNSLERPVHGCFAAELGDEDLRGKRILLMDCHWFFSLDSVGQIAKRAKALNPDITVIVGGYTASIFFRELIGRFGVDYVVRGDAERPLPNLIQSLLGDGDPSMIPNVAHRDFVNGTNYQLSREDYDDGNYLDIDWFPSLEKLSHETHRIASPTWIFPFIPVFKGCIYPCEYCLGNPAAQKALCGRGVVSRSPERVVADLRTVEATPHLRRAYIIADFLDILPAPYADVVLAKRFDLDLYYEFYRVPKSGELKRLAASFRRTFLACFYVQNHGNVEADDDSIGDISRVAQEAREAGASLSINIHMKAIRDRAVLSRRLWDVFAVERWVNLIDSTLWDIPMPKAGHAQNPTDGAFDEFLRLSTIDPWMWRLREFIVERFFRGTRRYRVLFRVNTWRVALTLFARGRSG